MKPLRLALVLAMLCWAAGARAAITPGPGPSDPRIQVVQYGAEDVVELHATLGFEMTIEFGRGERLENIAIGDSASWQVTPNKRGDLLFVKPVQKHAPTNMTVITNLRRYDFNLRAASATAGKGGPPPIFGIRFDYPIPESPAAVMLKPSRPPPPSAPEPPSVANKRYSYEGSQGLIPTRLFDDGSFTYFQFAPDQDYPAVYIVGLDGKESVMNYSVRQGFLVVDKVAPGFVLRRGPLVTRIFNDGFKAPVASADSPRPRARKSLF